MDATRLVFVLAVFKAAFWFVLGLLFLWQYWSSRSMVFQYRYSFWTGVKCRIPFLGSWQQGIATEDIPKMKGARRRMFFVLVYIIVGNAILWGGSKWALLRLGEEAHLRLEQAQQRR